MIIYSMTATFGKLENQTLTLEPGLNVIHAPNEWGKSTWCAFLVAMLYGMDTRAKSKKNALADKERYAPWSGIPMEGRIDLNWQGRDITIERKTKRRVPLGEFRAYETQSGLAVPELDAANCGQKLLGVEQSVFLRAGFVRFSDLPVTHDDALRRRLNALVTTGDENTTGDRLAVQLRDLKNRCRYHKSGLLPQAEAQRSELTEKLEQLDGLQGQEQTLTIRLTQVQQRLAELENHRKTLRYESARQDADKVAQAQQLLVQAQARFGEIRDRCVQQPDMEQTQAKLWELKKLAGQRLDLQVEANMLPTPPEPEDAPLPFRGLDGDDALAQAQADAARAEALGRNKPWLAALAVCLMAAGGLLAVWKLPVGLAVLAAGGSLLAAALIKRALRRGQARRIAEKYEDTEPPQWISMAQAYRDACCRYRQQMVSWQQTRQELESRVETLNQKIRQASDGRELDAALDYWQKAQANWERLAEAAREVRQWEHHAEALRAMAKPAEKPAFADSLTYSPEETARLLSDSQAEQHLLQNRLGQCQGMIRSLGQREAMQTRRAQTDSRIRELERTYAALTLAQETLAQATSQLQRRFAPRITARARQLMSDFTNGRYDRVSLEEDLSVRAGTDQEATLRELLWRSDGTVDQLYLALRLAVAEELTPECPVVLDDVLIRFDDTRAGAALACLKQMGHSHQILLFTCHSREQSMI